MATATQNSAAAEELDLTGIGGEDDLKGGFDYIKAGTYHVAFTAIDLQPLSRKNEYLNGKRLDFQILAGTDVTQVGKSGEEIFFNPDPSNKDGGKFLLKRQARLALKTGLVSLADLGKKASINWNDIVARQCIVVIEEREFTSANGSKGKNSQIKGLEIYSVNDPEMIGVPKDAEALEFMKGLVPEAVGANGSATPAATQQINTPATSPAPPAVTPEAPAADPFAGM